MAHHPVEDSNTSDNPSLESVVGARLSRRDVLRGSASAATIAVLGGVGLAACDGDDDDDGAGTGGGNDAGTGGGTSITQDPQSLGFTPAPKSTADAVVVPPGYRAEVLIAKGDPIAPGIAPFKNDGTDGDYDQRSGDEHDAMHLFMMNASGEFDPEATDRGILLTNHENLEDATIHENGLGTPANGARRPKVEVDREMNLHGVSCVEIRKVAGSTGRWEYLQDSTFNRRVTAFTEMEITGPARGADFMRTRTDPDGTTRLGTLNNCAHGFTPWGTYLACEENWFSYFNRGGDEAQREPADNARLARYGMGPNSQGFSYREWDTVAGDTYERFNITATGASATDDYRNEPNRFGYAVEIDPFRPGQKPKVRTAFGRMAHEGAWPAAFVAGQPLVYYMGDDARSEYIYKYVSNANWDPADANLGLAAGDKYLDDGTLYVAVFNEDGSGEWRELSGAALAGFTDAEVAAFTREAADSVNATKMDRPEWAAVNPFNGDVYLCMTNNRARNSRFDGTNAANPRFFVDDVAPVDDGNAGNAFGHIIRWREANDDPAATSFAWDIFLFAAEGDSADPDNINISGLGEDNDFASPDGLFFDARGVMWIQTDGGDLRSETNNMMLAALPNLASRAGEGQALTVTATVDDTDSGSGITAGVSEQDTRVATRDAASVDLRRFLVGARGCEITGIIVTPDARTLFCNVQHPGEGGDPALFNSDVSTWPAASGDATQPGEPGRRTRSATIMVYREDGGEIAL